MIHPEHQFHENDLCLRAETGRASNPHSHATVNLKYADSSAKLRLYPIDRANFTKLCGGQCLRHMSMDINQLVRPSVHQIQPSTSADDYKECATQPLSRYKNLLKGDIRCVPNAEVRLELTTADPQPVCLRACPMYQKNQMDQQESENLWRFRGEHQ